MKCFIATSVIAALLVLASSLAGAPSPQEVRDLGSGDILVRFDELNGTDLVEFLKLYQELSGSVIRYEPSEVQGVKIHVLGDKVIERQRLHAYFRAILKSCGFDLVELGELLLVTRGPVADRPAVAPFVAIDQIDPLEDPSRRFTVVFALRSAEAEEVARALRSIEPAGRTGDTVQAVASVNAVVMVAGAERLRRAAKVLAALEGAQLDESCRAPGSERAGSAIFRSVAVRGPGHRRIWWVIRGAIASGPKVPRAVKSCPCRSPRTLQQDLQDLVPFVGTIPTLCRQAAGPHHR